jgi:hypothetical protein
MRQLPKFFPHTGRDPVLKAIQWKISKATLVKYNQWRENLSKILSSKRDARKNSHSPGVELHSCGTKTIVSKRYLFAGIANWGCQSD